jgi:dihydrofolate synthase / folylpolyglutamate synthase
MSGESNGDEARRRDLEARLYALPKFGAGVGLHRVAALLADVRESPWMAGLDAIKVTGSNGKGSVCAMTAAILGALGVSTGLYTSPHLRAFRERIVVGGEPISDADLERALEWVEPRVAAYHRAHPGDTIGAFEAYTAMAMSHFAEVRPRALVVEAGIGGRYDATRLVPGSITALTSVDLEHTAILGATTDLIAYDKADLCPDGGVLVAGALAPDLDRRLAAYCELRRIRLVRGACAAVIRSFALGDSHMTADVEIDGLRLRDLRIALQGEHQVMNAIVAVLLVRAWASRHLPGLAPEDLEPAIRRGLAEVRWPGRFECVHHDPDVYIDVGHSPGAIDVLARTVRAALPGRRILLVTGVSYDKAVEPIVGGLLGLASEVICTRAHHKGSPVSDIERIVRAAAPHLPARVAPTIEEAMEMAVRRASEAGMTVLVAGGLFLCAEAAEALRGRDPRGLRFF